MKHEPLLRSAFGVTPAAREIKSGRLGLHFPESAYKLNSVFAPRLTCPQGRSDGVIYCKGKNVAY